MLHTQAFEIWYSAKRQFAGVTKISEEFRVHTDTVYGWMAKYDWHRRADKRDEEIRKKAEPTRQQEVADLLKEENQMGKLLRAKAVEHFRVNRIDKAADAINATVKGVELSRRALGLPNDVGQQQVELNVTGKVDITEAALLDAIERLMNDEAAMRKLLESPKAPENETT